MVKVDFENLISHKLIILLINKRFKFRHKDTKKNMIWRNLLKRFRHIYAFFDRYGEKLSIKTILAG